MKIVINNAHVRFNSLPEGHDFYSKSRTLSSGVTETDNGDGTYTYSGATNNSNIYIRDATTIHENDSCGMYVEIKTSTGSATIIMGNGYGEDATGFGKKFTVNSDGIKLLATDFKGRSNGNIQFTIKTTNCPNFTIYKCRYYNMSEIQ